MLIIIISEIVDTIAILTDLAWFVQNFMLMIGT